MKDDVMKDGGPPCNQDQRAPHGFLRNASHDAGRYVCECEGWRPPLNFCTRVADYFATGEGRTLAIVIGPTPASVERLFIKYFGEWLNSGAESFVGVPDRGVSADYIPEPVIEMAEEIPEFIYYAQFDFNLS